MLRPVSKLVFVHAKCDHTQKLAAVYGPASKFSSVQLRLLGRGVPRPVKL